ncbi:hypothetical protein GCM10010440_38860 [Kitasatospora cinereorecta]
MIFEPPRTDGRARLDTVGRNWRYPVKSTGGEALEESAVDARGLAGDRLHAASRTAGSAAHNLRLDGDGHRHPSGSGPRR